MSQFEVQLLCQRVEMLRNRLNQAAKGRSYTLLAATKTQPPETINLLPSVEIYDFGENRVQEWLEKMDSVEKCMRFHMIGRLQSNKIKYIINSVVLVHSVDRISLAEELDRQANLVGRKIDVLLQVNTAREIQKGGVLEEELPQLLQTCSRLENIKVKGLMCMAPDSLDETPVRSAFAQAYRLYEDMRRQWTGVDTLSMGMSHDAEIALSEGSNLVRIGSSLFKQRT